MNDLFDFKLCDITTVSVAELRCFFTALSIDTFDTGLYGIKPFRQRKVIYIRYNNGTISYSKKTQFKQNVSDVRNQGRSFSVYKLVNDEQVIFEKFITGIAEFIKKKNKINSNLEITVHFVQINASKEGASNSPEGIHRDEFDILIPCLVVDRVNIKGGASRAFINNKIVFRRIIKPGEGLIINEGNNPDVYHDVEPIFLKDENKPGFRRIIGIDINVI